MPYFFREVFDGYLELEGIIKMTLQQASRRIPYKYVVVRPQDNGRPPKLLWECLVGFKPLASGHVNRCLHIRDDSLKDNGKAKYQLIFTVYNHSCFLLSPLAVFDQSYHNHSHQQLSKKRVNFYIKINVWRRFAKFVN